MTPQKNTHTHQLSHAHHLMTIFGIPIMTSLLGIVLWFIIKHYESQERINENLIQQANEHEIRINLHDYILTQKGLK